MLKSYNISWTRLSDIAIVKTICKNFKQMRLNKNWSQSQLAKQSGLDRVTISRMENGRSATMLTLIQVLRALDKLELLNVFEEDQLESPLKLLKEQEMQRKRASPKKKTIK